MLTHTPRRGLRINGTGGIFALMGVLIVLGAVFFRPKASEGAPRTPAADAEVLERLPASGGGPNARREARLRKTLLTSPNDLTAALILARLDIEEARARSDPRFLGYAQAALAPWWQLEGPPNGVLLLRATIRQSLHEFVPALADLDRLLAREPESGQAWLTRSVVLTVLGRYAEARASCDPLMRLATALVGGVCIASVEAVTGHARDAYVRVDDAMASEPSASGAERGWAESTLGETALRLGRNEDAERHFVAALSLDPNDAYVLGAYADLLLDTGRAIEAARLLAGRKDNDGLLLRLAMAEAAIGSADARADVALVGERFDAARLRGDRLHAREEARFELRLRHDARRAVSLATDNFAVQKEPWDVRIALEAALAAGAPAAASEPLVFIAASGLEDPTIAALASRLAATPR